MPDGEMTTWRRADGEPIWGEFDFVTDDVWLEEGEFDEPTEILKEVWTRVSSETTVYGQPEPDEDEDD